jgi:hypothetical protein
MNRFLACLAALLFALAARASAQTYTYFMDEVTTVSKPILLSPGYMTILEFYDDVDQVMSGRPNLVKIAGVTGSKLYLTALSSSGVTDLVVDVAQRSHMFRLSIVSGTMARRYVIVQRPKPTPPSPTSTSAPRATPPAAPTAPKPASATTPVPRPAANPAPVGVAPTTPSRPRPASVPTTTQTTSTTTPPPTAAPIPPVAAQATRPVRADAAVNPVWLDLVARHLQPDPATGQTTLFLVVRNSGTRTVLLDERDIRVSERARTTELRVVNPSSSVVTLEPGQALTVRVVIKGPLPRELTVSWTMFDFSSDAAYLITRGLNVEENTAGPRG